MNHGPRLVTKSNTDTANVDRTYSDSVVMRILMFVETDTNL